MWAPLCHDIFHVDVCAHRVFLTYSFAIPAIRTAEETALMAVMIALRSCVRSPVASGILRCSLSTKRVRVMQLVSKSAMSLWITAEECTQSVGRVDRNSVNRDSSGRGEETPRSPDLPPFFIPKLVKCSNVWTFESSHTFTLTCTICDLQIRRWGARILLCCNVDGGLRWRWLTAVTGRTTNQATGSFPAPAPPSDYVTRTTCNF